MFLIAPHCALFALLLIVSKIAKIGWSQTLTFVLRHSFRKIALYVDSSPTRDGWPCPELVCSGLVSINQKSLSGYKPVLTNEQAKGDVFNSVCAQWFRNHLLMKYYFRGTSILNVFFWKIFCVCFSTINIKHIFYRN